MFLKQEKSEMDDFERTKNLDPKETYKQKFQYFKKIFFNRKFNKIFLHILLNCFRIFKAF